MADKLSHEYQPIFESLGFEEKLALLKTVMEKEGYELGWERKGDAYEIDEIACPFYQIGRDHPEICLFDKSLISNLLSVPEENIKHLRTGENRCTFQVQRSN